ncbi:PhoX family protein [Coralloluteibacterium stylophorae]|uniref:PhoX family phosphatase n=1 Tax=Coralloluteibacterium stylophorae TaxID=1776034 RepID=A0A8J7VRP4_9GAMM|nr:PhoX family phosphatase [Coralloluteibacterium stylophorae]MBS7456982.1 PhoX family phosphatase [Coralloluteibacterium stylophorae]
MDTSDRPATPAPAPEFDNEDSNRSGNRPFTDVLRVNLQRRSLMKGGVGLAVGAGLLGRSPVAEALGRDITGPVHGRGTLNFDAVPVGRADTIVVPDGYRAEAAFAWGEPLRAPFPAYLDGGLNSAFDQRRQVGQHHDGVHYFPLGFGTQGSSHGLLVMNHEYIDPQTLHPDGPTTGADGRRPLEEIDKEIAAHGVSVIEIARRGRQWSIVRGAWNRRITGATPMRLSGPVRGHALARTRYSPDGTRTRGTLNNCASGMSPWGTYLTCEENWAGYFVNRDAAIPREHARYGIGAGSRYGWESRRRRFDASTRADDAAGDFRNNPNTYGWVVEIDPADPRAMPVKRTALGRFGHEGIVFGKPRLGRPLAFYMGDDATGEYIYKFVTRDRYIPGLARGEMLDHGTLYAARFDDDGRGEWLALDIHDPAFRAAADAAGVHFADQADVLVNTRLAADVAGATPMDRPEWGAVDPRSGEVYFTLTNNGARAPGDTDEANPRGPNPYGHIITFREDGGRNEATRFEWDLFLLAGPPADSVAPDGGSLDADNILASPDGLWFDGNGLLWIQTDMSGSQLAQGPFGNNQMLVADPRTRVLKRFLVGPVGCEVTGVTGTPDGRTLFVNIQHPGENGGSDWPDGNGARPRSATVVVTREDGGVIGL